MSENKTIYMPCRNITIFISSSFSHNKVRLHIKELLERDNDSNPTGDLRVHITAHLHEREGQGNITPGVASQDQINAFCENCTAFLLYVGNKIGEHTAQEFENVLANARRNYHFIFVVHNPEDIIREQPGTRYFDWKEFSDKHMRRADGIVYYEKDPTGIGLDQIILGIRDEIASQVLVPLYPQDMDYGNMLSGTQRKYRDSGTFYLPRDIDSQVSEFLNDTNSMLGIVTGMSLAGKTRVVIENLKKLDRHDIRIHYLSRDESAIHAIRSLNFKLQFPTALRHILFVDDIDETFFSTRDTTLKFIELCQFAADNPGRLVIIATTVRPFDEIKQEYILANANAASWTSRCRELPIKPMTRNEVYMEVRRLKGLNRLEHFDMGRLREGMPLGALFVDMDRLLNIYNSINQPILFEAIKTLWLWKRRSRTRPKVLRKFINAIYEKELEEDLSSDALYKLLRDVSSLINVRGESLAYTYETEEILVDEIFRFRDQPYESTQQDPTATELAYKHAVDRIIRYIDRHDREHRFQEFSKLCQRLLKRKSQPYLFDYAIEKIRDRYPADLKLTEINEEIPMADSQMLNGVHLWITILVHHAIKHRDLTEARRIYELFPTDWVLAEILEDYSLRRDFTPILFRDGQVEKRYAGTRCRQLLNRLISMATLDEAIRLMRGADYADIALASMTDEFFDETYHHTSVRFCIGLSVCKILSKVTSFAELRDKVLPALHEQNAKCMERHQEPLFHSECEMFFDLINFKAWQTMSTSITSFDLPQVFDLLLGVQVPEGQMYDAMRMNKTTSLNFMIQPMSPPVAFEAWRKMGPIKDSYTLMCIISKCPDFSLAFGFVESFMNEQGRDRINLGRLFANKLLDTAATQAELEECEKLYRRMELLPADADQKARQSGIPPLCVTYDEALYVSLISKDFVGMDVVRNILRYMKDNDMPYSRNLLTKIMDRAADYAEAYQMVYGECDYLSEQYRSMMRVDPVVLSLLIRKASRHEEIAHIKGMVEDIIAEASASPDESSSVLDQNCNILSEYLKNRNLVGTYRLGCDFLNHISSCLGVVPESPFIDRALMSLLWEYDPDHDRQYKIRTNNDLILKRCRQPRRDLRSLTNFRFLEGRSVSAAKRMGCNFYDVEDYPYIGPEGNWELRKVTGMDFLVNMMEHRFAHAGSLEVALVRLGSMALENPEKKDYSVKTCHRILDIAIRTGLFTNYDGFVEIRKVLSRLGDSSLVGKIGAIASEYSVMKDVCHNMHQGNITCEEALSRIKAVENQYGIRLYRTQTFYDAMVHRMTLVNEASVESILKWRDRTFPQGMGWTDEQKYYLLHKVRSADDFNTLRKIFGTLPEDWYKAILKAVQKTSYSRLPTTDALISRALGLQRLDGKDFAYPEFDIHACSSAAIGMFCYMYRMNFKRLYWFVVNNSLETDQDGFKYLVSKAKCPEHLERLKKLKGFSWHIKTAVGLLDNLNKGKYFWKNDLELTLDYVEHSLIEDFRAIYHIVPARQDTDDSTGKSANDFVNKCQEVYDHCLQRSAKSPAHACSRKLADICQMIMKP